MKLTPQEEQTIKAYDDNAKAWAESRSDASWWDSEKKIFENLAPKGKLIEIGSGGGRDAKFLIDLGYEYTGVDVSEGLLKEAKKNNPGAKFLLQSVYELDFPDEEFDAFWAAAVLLHMPKDRMSEALKSIYRVLKSGGVGFISLKKGEGEKFVEGDHTGISYSRFFSFWQEDEFNNTLEKNGFEVLKSNETTYSNKPWLVFFVKKS